MWLPDVVCLYVCVGRGALVCWTAERLDSGCLSYTAINTSRGLLGPAGLEPTSGLSKHLQPPTHLFKLGT